MSEEQRLLRVSLRRAQNGDDYEQLAMVNYILNQMALRPKREAKVLTIGLVIGMFIGGVASHLGFWLAQ